jgi:isoleucyl-tRNA synthetase
MNAYNLSKATRPLINFVDNLSNWYIRRSRRRFWKSENDSDKKQAYATLYFVLTEFCKLIAPFTPFIADEIYRNLTNKESVHLEKWPEVNKKMINTELNKKMQLARTIVSLGHSIRSHQNIKVRQPLAKIKIAVPSKDLASYVQQLEDVITEELNVKSLEILANPDKEVTKLLKPNAKELGPILGPKMKEVLQAARENKFKIEENTVLICDEKLNLNKFEVVYQAKEGYSAESQNGIVAVLDTNITKSLKQEGAVRDIVRLVQEFRKEMDYNVSDRIYLYLETDDKDLQEAILNFADYLKKETLAIELQNSGDFEWDSEKLTEVDSTPITIAIKRAEV